MDKCFIQIIDIVRNINFLQDLQDSDNQKYNVSKEKCVSSINIRVAIATKRTQVT